MDLFNEGGDIVQMDVDDYDKKRDQLWQQEMLTLAEYAEKEENFFLIDETNRSPNEVVSLAQRIEQDWQECGESSDNVFLRDQAITDPHDLDEILNSIINFVDRNAPQSDIILPPSSLEEEEEENHALSADDNTEESTAMEAEMYQNAGSLSPYEYCPNPDDWKCGGRYALDETVYVSNAYMFYNERVFEPCC